MPSTDVEGRDHTPAAGIWWGPGRVQHESGHTCFAWLLVASVSTGGGLRREPGATARWRKSSRSNRSMKLRTGEGTGTITGRVHQCRPNIVTASSLTLIGPIRGSDAMTA